MKWTGTYLIGYVMLIGGVMAALWKMGVLASVGLTWTVIGVTILNGFGIMMGSLPHLCRGKIGIDRK